MAHNERPERAELPRGEKTVFHGRFASGRSLANVSSPDTLMTMVSYAELCQAIERWQRSQGRVTALDSALQQAMWRGFIQHHAPDVQMEFQREPPVNAAPEALQVIEPVEPNYDQPVSLDDDLSVDNLDSLPYAATGS